jgi:hypothetical protein
MMTGDGWFRFWLFASIGLGATACNALYTDFWWGLAATAATFGSMFMAGRASGG